MQEYIDGFELILPFARDARDAAPEEIAEDFDTLVEAIEGLRDDLDTVTDVDQAEALLEQTFEDPELDAAGDRVDDYYDATCPQADDDANGGAAGSPSTVTVPDPEG